ncbi:hypothetical protein LOTGIDRAFT_229990 [Lottia gigantea]|uniref:Uncharacterized protein n=1 Tax=Lottia gigantea TaxID=225164 RepID=V4CR15_LOTGI|nr:hypothetical protein LOTGIDRAFT_229990 [Lottia gigantea]ESP04915.1 hypothetical protein LOTGIDRAFT_229990 [Lottia gigantea]
MASLVITVGWNVHGSDDTFGWKKNTPLGHVDFYPNGGSLQTGCPRSRPGSCSHIRAPLLFTNSIRRCQYLPRAGAANCPAGPVADVRMGYYSYTIMGRAPSTYCLETAGSPPYC